MATDSNNHVILVGTTDSNSDMNGDGDMTDSPVETNTAYSVYVSVFDSVGNHQWALRLGDGQAATSDTAYAVATDSFDRIYITGVIQGTADVNGDGDETDGGAENTVSGLGGYNGFVTSFDAAGNWLWARRLSGVNGGMGKGVTVHPRGGAIVAGYLGGSADLNSDGDYTDGGAESSVGYTEKDLFISGFVTSPAKIIILE